MRWANVSINGRAHAGLVEEETIHLTPERDVSELLGKLDVAGRPRGSGGIY